MYGDVDIDVIFDEEKKIEKNIVIFNKPNILALICFSLIKYKFTKSSFFNIIIFDLKKGFIFRFSQNHRYLESLESLDFSSLVL